MNKTRFLKSIRKYVTNPEVTYKEICHISKDCNKCRLVNCKKSKAYSEVKR